MTQKEIYKFLANTKVYVNGKSKEIQEKLFSFGYDWSLINHRVVKHTTQPFLFTDKNGNIACGNDMDFFKKNENREISAEQILSLEVTEPTYRPFKNQEECWEEMLKHHPFGWFRHKRNNYYEPIRVDISEDAAFNSLFNVYNFADGTPFGILEN